MTDPDVDASLPQRQWQAGRNFPESAGFGEAGNLACDEEHLYGCHQDPPTFRTQRGPLPHRRLLLMVRPGRRKRSDALNTLRIINLMDGLIPATQLDVIGVAIVRRYRNEVASKTVENPRYI